MLPYTICFCLYEDKVLMLYRNYPPNQHLWNGLGGKLHPDETPFTCVQREVMEEANIDLQQASYFNFAGVITWAVGADPTSSSAGMYAFVAEFSPGWSIWEDERQTAEGLLCWKPLQWVCDPRNSAVVDNIPHFLPAMLSQGKPAEYYCDYQDKRFVRLVTRPLRGHFMPELD